MAPPTPPIGLAPPTAVMGMAQPPPAQPVRPQAPDFKFAPRSGQPQPPQPPPPPDLVACMTCGHSNQRGLRFCVSCGQAVGSSISPRAATVEAPALPAPHTAAPIAPARVVELGAPPVQKSTIRVCARCRGACDHTAQFCKFCGAPLIDPSGAPIAVAGPPAPPTSKLQEALPHSAAPETPAIDAQQYRPYQAMSAASSSAGTPSNASAPLPSFPLPSFQSPPHPSAQPTGVMSAVTIPNPWRGRLVIIARDGGEGPAFPLADVTDIGRTEGNVLLAEDRYISPRHARVFRRDGQVFLRDLGSVNGIYLRIPSGLGTALTSTPPPSALHGSAGGVPAVGGGSASQAGGAGVSSSAAAQEFAVPLQDQDLFLVGQQVLRFEVVTGAEEGYGTASQHGTLLFGTPAAPRYARLSQRTVEGVTRDVFYIRKVETVLGRESGDIVFTEDPFLSRRHAAIRVDVGAKRFALADLGSSNGTFLQIREEVRLKDGDHFRIGQQLFRIDIEAAAPRA